MGNDYFRPLNIDMNNMIDKICKYSNNYDFNRMNDVDYRYQYFNTFINMLNNDNNVNLNLLKPKYEYEHYNNYLSLWNEMVDNNKTIYVKDYNNMIINDNKSFIKIDKVYIKKSNEYKYVNEKRKQGNINEHIDSINK